MFRGINGIALDVKGRMAIPARYRQRLQKEAKNQLVATIDTEERCLLLYPMPVWEVIESKIEALPSFQQAVRRIQRLLIGHATELEMDSHGRVLVPPLLREYATIEKNVMLVGQGKKFEIWNDGQWHANRDKWLAEAGNGASGLPTELNELSL